jgi:hypothetical protein
MNCKPGDLAVVVRSTCGNEGKVVRCVRYLGEVGCIQPDGALTGPFHAWEIDSWIRAWDGTLKREVFDKNLRPIRDNDGEDESLSWAGKPEGITA